MRNISTAFIERREFDSNTPWYVAHFDYKLPWFSPPHYAETIEICHYYHVTGAVQVDNHTFTLGGDTTIYIPPNSIHAMNYSPCDGYCDIIKLEPQALFSCLDIPRLYALNQLDIVNIPFEMPGNLSDRLARVISNTENNVFDVYSAILDFYKEAAKYVASDSISKDGLNPKENEVIRGIMKWTEENYSKALSLDQIAKQFNYSKNYFCNKFKSVTDVSYWDYLHSVRVYHACGMLKAGVPISQISEQCGYNSVSYFIQLFKKELGVTPSQYLSQLHDTIVTDSRTFTD